MKYIIVFLPEYSEEKAFLFPNFMDQDIILECIKYKFPDSYTKSSGFVYYNTETIDSHINVSGENSRKKDKKIINKEFTKYYTFKFYWSNGDVETLEGKDMCRSFQKSKHFGKVFINKDVDPKDINLGEHEIGPNLESYEQF